MTLPGHLLHGLAGGGAILVLLVLVTTLLSVLCLLCQRKKHQCRWEPPNIVNRLYTSTNPPTLHLCSCLITHQLCFLVCSTITGSTPQNLGLKYVIYDYNELEDSMLGIDSQQPLSSSEQFNISDRDELQAKPPKRSSAYQRTHDFSANVLMSVRREPAPSKTPCVHDPQ